MPCRNKTELDIVSSVATITPGDSCGFDGDPSSMTRHGRTPGCCGTKKIGAAANNAKESHARAIEAHVKALSRSGALGSANQIRGDNEVRQLKPSFAYFREKMARDSTGRQPDQGSLAFKLLALADSGAGGCGPEA